MTATNDNDAEAFHPGRIGERARCGCTGRWVWRTHTADALADGWGARARRTRILRNTHVPNYFTNRARPGTTGSRSASISPSSRNFATLLAVIDLTMALRMETFAPSLIVIELLGA